jgi:hypothetical protein
VLLSEYYVRWFFAKQYPHPVLLTQLFMAGFLLCAMDFVASGVLHAADRQRWDTKASAIGGVANVALLFGLIPLYGIYGAFAAKVGSTALQSVLKFAWLEPAAGVRWRSRELAALAGAVAGTGALAWLLADAAFAWKLAGIAAVAVLLPAWMISTSLLRPVRLLRFYWRGGAEARGLIDTAVRELRRARRDALDRETASLLLHRLARFMHLRRRTRIAALLSRGGAWLLAAHIDPTCPEGPRLPRLSTPAQRGHR